MQVTKGWLKALKTATEFKLQPLQVLEGQIPLDLNGSLYRNGPGRLERGGEPYGHLFDGDGAVLGIHFRGGKAEGVYQFVKGKAYLEEEKAGKLLYPTITTKSRRGFIKTLLDPAPKNPSNTSVLLVKDKLLALCEAGWPFALDPKTLESIGPDNLGELLEGEMYSAHPKVDPDTGEIFNVGQVAYPPALLVYKSNKEGKIVKKNKVQMRGLNMIHDCVIAGKYLVVFIPPLEINIWKLVLGIATYSELIRLNPELGTEVLVFDRNDLSLVSRFKTDPFFVFHFSNGYEEKDGSINIEFAKHEDFDDIWKATQDPLRPRPGITLKPRLTAMRIDPKQGKVLEMTSVGGEEIGEFPTVADSLVGKEWRYSLYVTSPPQKKFIETDDQFQSIARFDRKKQKVQIRHYGPNKYVNEPLLVSSKEDPEQGYILNQIYDAEKNASELWIHDTKELEGEPVCRIGLPEVIPFGFHGRYHSAT